MRFAQGVYPICQDDETAIDFMKFVHLRGNRSIQDAGGPWAPQVYMSIMERVRSHMLHTCSATCVFRPANQAKRKDTTKHFLPGIIIKFLTKHTFTDSFGGLEFLPAQDYQGQIH